MSKFNEDYATISLSDATALTPFRKVNYLYHETLVLLRAGRGTLFSIPPLQKYVLVSCLERTMDSFFREPSRANVSIITSSRILSTDRNSSTPLR